MHLKIQKLPNGGPANGRNVRPNAHEIGSQTADRAAVAQHAANNNGANADVNAGNGIDAGVQAVNGGGSDGVVQA